MLLVVMLLVKVAQALRTGQGRAALLRAENACWTHVQVC